MVASPLEGVLSVVKVKEGQAARRGEQLARVFDPQQLDPTYRIDEIRVGDDGHVRIAGAVR